MYCGNNLRGFSAWQIKDLFAPSLALRRNGGWERFRISTAPIRRCADAHTPSVGSCSQSAYALSSSFAFTLAEVLITLAIIGVIAALTIPVLVKDYQKKEAAVKLKKTYATLTNVAQRAIADNGPTTSWAQIYDPADFARTFFVPYLKKVKDCGVQTTGECAFKFRDFTYSDVTTLGTNIYRLYLVDGTLVAITPTSYGYTYNGARFFDYHANILVDINGQKGPNCMGRDIFGFTLYMDQGDSSSGKYTQTQKSGKLSPDNHYAQGYQGQSNYWSYWEYNDYADNMAECQSYGYSCSNLIVRDGWEIKYDWNIKGNDNIEWAS